MLGRIATAAFLLLTSLIAESAKSRPELELIERAKNVNISRFDALLPRLTLESFLKYETHNAAIRWQVWKCAEDLYYLWPGRSGKAMCVEALSDIADGRVVRVVVALQLEAPAQPFLVAASIIEQGLEQPLKLIQLPAAIHRSPFRRRFPRDLLPPGTAG